MVQLFHCNSRGILMMNTSEAGDARKPIVLCIDDEPAVLRSIKRTLQPLNITLLATDNPDKAIEALRRYRVSVLLTDLLMPAMPSSELLKTASELQPDMYHLVLTGHTDVSIIASALSASRVDHIMQKPWESAELLDTVREGLEVAAIKAKNIHLRRQSQKLNRALNQEKLVLRAGVEKRTRQLKSLLSQMRERQQQTESVLLNIVEQHPWLRVRESARIGNATERVLGQLTQSMTLSADLQHAILLAGKLCQIGLVSAATSFDDQNLKSMSFELRSRFYSQTDAVFEIFSPSQALNTTAQILHEQFEYVNGQGYPGKRAGDQITLGARILAVARDYCWLRNGFLNGVMHNHDEAIMVIYRHRDIFYDSRLIGLLEKLA